MRSLEERMLQFGTEPINCDNELWNLNNPVVQTNTDFDTFLTSEEQCGFTLLGFLILSMRGAQILSECPGHEVFARIEENSLEYP